MSDIQRKNLGLEILKKIMMPIILVAAFILIYSLFKARIQPFIEKKALVAVGKGAFIIIVLLSVYFITRISDGIFEWYRFNIAAKTKSKLDDEFLPLFRRSAKIILWTIGLIIILNKLGVNINALIAALGVGSLAIALAAQDTISNIIAGFLIMVDRPFRIEDDIKLPSGEKVKVLKIGIRRSTFKAEDGAIIIVPNLDLSKNRITNYTYGQE